MFQDFRFWELGKLGTRGLGICLFSDFHFEFAITQLQDYVFDFRWLSHIVIHIHCFLVILRRCSLIA